MKAEPWVRKMSGTPLGPGTRQGLGSSGGLLGRPDPYLVKVVAWLAPHPLSCVSVGAVCASVLALALWF